MTRVRDRALAALCTVIALGATAAHGRPPDSPPKITRPAWKRQPTGAIIESVMPKRAIEQGVDGKATIECSVSELGLLGNCKLVSEAPPGYGFGAAALAMAPFFQMTPLMADGKPVAGGTVTIPINWKLPREGRSVSGRSLLASPPWAAAPSWADMRAAWPSRAQDVSDGFVTLRCRLTDEGAPIGCVAISEAPEKLGFEAAAKALAKSFRLSFGAAEQPTLKTLAVDIPFHFRDPDQGDPRKLGSPRWVRTLSPAAMAALYPAAARAAGVFTGRGWVHCVATSTGDLTECAERREEPGGLGFGPAALEAAKIMRMNPWTVDGEPVEGLGLTVPIRFTWDDTVPSDKPD